MCAIRRGARRRSRRHVGGGHPPAQRGRLRISSEDYKAEEPHVGNVHIHLQDSPGDEAERGGKEGHARAGR